MKFNIIKASCLYPLPEMILSCAQLPGTKSDLEAAATLRGKWELNTIQKSPNMSLKHKNYFIYFKNNSICYGIYYTKSICLLSYDSERISLVKIILNKWIFSSHLYMSWMLWNLYFTHIQAKKVKWKLHDWLSEKRITIIKQSTDF